MFAVKINNISKSYKLYKSRKEPIKEIFSGKRLHKNFQALKNINLNIEKGKTFGILGRNGSGKTTLLRIISGIIEPSSGEVIVDGKISFLNISVGLDNELSGIDNVYLKGTLMGYSKKEIDSRLEDIIEFSELGIFASQPVKTYSSGMKSKLGFAIAINVDPDILIIDEALSVGDSRFRKKCHARLDEIKKQDKTIIYVSHNSKTVKNFCDDVVWIDSGEIVASGKSEDVVEYYEKFMKGDITKDEVKNIIKEHS